VLADIGDRIRAERKARYWSQEDLAGHARLNRRTVRKLEDGIGSLRSFTQACWGLGVRMDYLLSESWEFPERQIRLSEKQVRVLQAAASGRSLTVVGAELGMSPRLVAAYLSRIYQVLGVACLPVADRRAAAARVAVKNGLFDAANRTS
jgi:DNA-binding NarL/FixJ family response regulator